MRLGLLGGSFDPVHLGHLILAECCRQQCGLDAVWFLPTAVPPHKQDIRLTPAEHRVAMLELAVAGNPAFSVCRCEIDRGGVSYTVDTLERLRDEQPDRELFFLVGADMLLDLPHWRDAVRVCQLATPVAVCRPGCAIDFEVLRAIASPERIAEIRRCQVEMPEIGLSSTQLRRRVEAGQSIRYWTPSAVEMYIKMHGLYEKMPRV
ncbi:MAG: nicotinate-nucleotide adenylyltransferase [Planctomycetaceae bacterium]|nr:nicotinate-nucleotide adenylyltransferase [Planctomycetaceae bacterium]